MKKAILLGLIYAVLVGCTTCHQDYIDAGIPKCKEQQFYSCPADWKPGACP